MDLGGWTLNTAKAVSADGSWIAGSGTHSGQTEAWLAQIDPPFRLDWASADAGGGRSTGGVLWVSGTIGQADAGPLSGGDFRVEGGFWGVIAVIQEPGSPLLVITRPSPSTVLISWPNPSSGFVLQQCTDLNGGSWVEVTDVPQVVGDRKQVNVSPPAGNCFYRLKRL
jgi:hypothetical protein